MTGAYTPQKLADEWQDDPEIDCDVLRVCKTPSQIVHDKKTGKYTLSDQIFSSHGPGCSVELMSLIEAEGLTARDRLGAHTNAFGAKIVGASVVRQITNKDKDGKATERLGVAYTPIADGEFGGPNPFHADIFPPTSKSANRALSNASIELTDLFDEAKAAEMYAKRHGAKG